MGRFIDLTAADGFVLPAYVADPPAGTATRGGIVVIQEIFGVNSHIRAVADGYAAAGYHAVAPAIFHRVRPGVELGYTEADMKEGQALKAAVEALPAPGVMQDLQAAVDEASKAGPAGQVGIVGYCYGGLLSWRAAAMLEKLTCAVTYYGGGMTGADETARRPTVPVLSHFGDRDHYIGVDSVEAFRRAQPHVEVHRYDADHGFNCDQRGSWNEPAATRARERSLAFFARHLG